MWLIDQHCISGFFLLSVHDKKRVLIRKLESLESCYMLLAKVKYISKLSLTQIFTYDSKHNFNKNPAI